MASSGGADLAASAETLVTTAMASPAVSARTVEANAAESSAVQGAGGFTIASTGSLVQWVLFSLLTVSTGVAWERRRGLLRRLAAAGVSGRTIIEGKMMAMVIITFLQQVMLVLLGALAFGVGYFNSVGALLMTMVSLSVLAACVGLLISALFRSEPPVIATTVITAQLLAVLGGAWFPLEVTECGVLPGGALLPQRLDHGLAPRHRAQRLGRRRHPDASGHRVGLDRRHPRGGRLAVPPRVAGRRPLGAEAPCRSQAASHATIFRALSTGRSAVEQYEEQFGIPTPDTEPGMNLISVDYDIVMVNRPNERLYAKAMVAMLGNKCYREFEKRDAPVHALPGHPGPRHR